MPKHFWIYAFKGADNVWWPCDAEGRISMFDGKTPPPKDAGDTVIEFTKRAVIERVCSVFGHTLSPRYWKIIKIPLD